jgi:hypothetical protein
MAARLGNTAAINASFIAGLNTPQGLAVKSAK